MSHRREHMPDTGLEGFGGADMVTPSYKLYQATSGDVSGIDKELSVADIFDPINRKNYGKEIQCVLLSAKKKRMLFFDKEKDAGKTGRKCWSDDGVVPAGNVPSPVNDRCDYCENKNVDLQYELTMLDVKQSLAIGQPAVFKFISKGSTLFPTRTLITSLVRSGKPAREFVVTMRASKQANRSGKGTFASINWVNVLPMDDESVPMEVAALAEEAYEIYVGGVGPQPGSDDALDQEIDESGATGRF